MCPKGIYERTHRRRDYTVFIGTMLYHTGYTKRSAVHAFKRAQRGSKGYPAPGAGQVVALCEDGVPVKTETP